MKKKLVIYTAIIGSSYDQLLQPLSIRDDVDYICYVKKGTITVAANGIWQIKEVDYDNRDNTRIARYVKMHPHVLLPNYEYSLWIDGNVQIIDKSIYNIIDGKINNDVLVSSLSHPHTNCCYDDAYICIASHKDNIWRILAQIAFLKIHRFPKNFGLYETNVLFRNHISKKVVEFNEAWWSLLSRFSRRDQLGCTYCMRKVGIPMDYFLDKGYCARNSTLFKYYPHKTKTQSAESHEKGEIARWFRNLLKEIVGYRNGK